MKNNYYKEGFTLVTVALAVSAVLIVALSVFLGNLAGRSQARDEQRITDVKRMYEALNIYYEFNQKYPSSIGNQPQGLGNYIEAWPVAPVPSDGSCTDAANSYTYKPTEEGESYILGFCLGSEMQGYSSGYQEIKPN